MLMSVSVKEHQTQITDDYNLRDEWGTGQQDEAYRVLGSAEDKFEQDIKNILEFIQDSDMMSMMYDPETRKEVNLDLLRNWKAMYGKIYVSRITEDPVIYIWKPLLYLEYKQMVGTSTETGTVKWEDQFLREEAVLKKCLLYPKPTFEFLRNRRAGVGSTLTEQILFQSGFVPTDYAVNRIEMLG